MKSARVGAKLSNMRISRKWAVAWAQDHDARQTRWCSPYGRVCLLAGRMVDVQQRQGVRDRQINIQVTWVNIRVSEFIEQQRACFAQKIDARCLPRTAGRGIE